MFQISKRNHSLNSQFHVNLHVDGNVLVGKLLAGWVLENDKNEMILTNPTSKNNKKGDTDDSHSM